MQAEMVMPSGVQLTEVEWRLVAPIVAEIETLKKEQDALILVHNYQRSEIFHTIADVKGDSLALARAASVSKKKGPIVVCGVHFMAETAKILNPDRMVLSPDPSAGCSLAESITAEDMIELRAKNPGIPIIVYVNSSAEVKALSDACCTSSNVVQIVESFGVPEVIVAPDRHLADFAQGRTKTRITSWKGACEVHKLFGTRDVFELRHQHPETAVLVHPECEIRVQRAADFVGSTSQLADYIARHRPDKVSLLTECTMSDNLKAMFPKTTFVQPCSMCPHMRKIDLKKVRDVLKHHQYEVLISDEVLEPARRSLDYMMAVSYG